MSVIYPDEEKINKKETRTDLNTNGFSIKTKTLKEIQSKQRSRKNSAYI